MLSAAVEYVGPKVGLRDLCSQLVKAPSRMPANSFSLRHGSSLSFSLLFCFLISFQTILSAGHLVRDAAICVCFFLFSFAVLVIAPSRSKRTVEWKDRFLNGPSVSCPPVHLSNKKGRTVPVVVSSRLVSGGAHSLFISPPSFSSCFFLFCFVLFFPPVRISPSGRLDIGRDMRLLGAS